MRLPRRVCLTRGLITFVKDRAGHDRRYAIDSSKAERLLGYKARYTLIQGLRETVDLVSGERRMVALGAQRRLPEAIARKCLKTVPVRPLKVSQPQ